MRARATLVIGCLAVGIAAAGCSVREEEPTPTPEKVFVIVTPTPGTAPAVTRTVERPASWDVVRAGDNLSDIADDLGVSLRDLQEANGIEDPDSIFAGQILIVPTPQP